MKAPFVELYNGYMLRCQPHSTTDGHFVANLVISYAESGGQNEVLLAPSNSIFTTAREAADCSLAAGKQWVDANSS